MSENDLETTIEQPEPAAVSQDAGTGETVASAAAPVATEPDESDEPEGTLEIQGQVMVPLAALRAERKTTATLREKAQQFDQIAGWYQQSKPYIDFLQAHPDLITRQGANAPAPAAAPPPAAPAVNPAEEHFARTLDLYTPEGKPDTVRAKAVFEIVEQLADRKAEERVRPVQDMTLQERSMANYHQAAQAVAPNGAKVDPGLLWQIWQNGDPRVLSTTQGAAAAFLTALGMQGLQQQPTVAPPATAPVVTEAAGSRTPGRLPLSELDQRVMNVRGIDPKKYADYAKNFRPGDANILED